MSFEESMMRSNPWSVVDDDPAELIHVMKTTKPNGEIDHLYVRVDEELDRAIGILGATSEKGEEKLNEYSSLDVALAVRDKLRKLAVRDQILELAKKKLEVAAELDAISKLEKTSAPDEFIESGLAKEKQELEEQFASFEKEFDRIIAPQ